MSHPLNVAIIGGGIGGLSAALALTRAGHSATVYEQAAKIAPLGTSLSLWPNAMACLADLGVADEVIAQSAVLPAIAARRIDGTEYFRAELTELCAEFGMPAVCARRSVLQRVLMDALPPECIQLNHRLKSMTQNDGVQLGFASGAEVRADLVIAADGLNSTARQMVLNDGPPRYAGYGAWLGIADRFPNDIPRDEICEYYGPDGRFGVSPTDATHAYWFYVENATTPRQSPGPADTTDLREVLDNWPNFTRELLAATQDDHVVYAPFFDRPSARTWGAGRVLLLGDAIHPFTPNLGQGGCQAIEDAHVLGILSGRGLDPEAILPAYQDARAKRAAMFAKQSRQIGLVAQLTTPALRWVRNFLLNTASASRWEKQLRHHFTRPIL